MEWENQDKDSGGDTFEFGRGERRRGGKGECDKSLSSHVSRSAGESAAHRLSSATIISPPDVARVLVLECARQGEKNLQDNKNLLVN